MGRAALSNSDRSVVWLEDLIDAAEAVAASGDRCDPAVMKAFSHRLGMHREVRLLGKPADVNRMPLIVAVIQPRDSARKGPTVRRGKVYGSFG